MLSTQQSQTSPQLKRQQNQKSNEKNNYLGLLLFKKRPTNQQQKISTTYVVCLSSQTKQ